MKQAGDKLANELIVQTAYYLGVGLVNLINIFNPEVFSLEGDYPTLETCCLSLLSKRLGGGHLNRHIKQYVSPVPSWDVTQGYWVLLPSPLRK
jgi:predicted NBD/HSP70 family sugar kinase